MAPQTTQSKAKSAQEFVPIKEIREGVIVLNDGSIRAVLMASSLNFALKSAEEQEATVFQYQNFLNSLDFSVEFIVESRNLNIAPYLDTLRTKEKEETSDLLKIQIHEYIEFIKNFVETANIVSKIFYVSVPYIPPILEIKKGGILSSLFGGAKKTASDKNQKFDEMKMQLWQRVDAVSQGLVRTGIRIVPLNTEELIELFYGLFNPGEAEKGGAPTMG